MKTRPLLILPFVLLSACASKSDLLYVQDELAKLKEESQNIKTQSAGSFSEITQSREELSSLRGGIEELRHDYSQSLARLDTEDSLMVRKANDMESRLARIEQYLGLQAGSKNAEVAAAPADATPGAAAKPETKTPEELLLAEGVARMAKADYSGARESFTGILTKYPKSAKVADAQFNIAESYFREKWYEKAILEYQVVIAKYTKSAVRPAALYRQALAFEQIGDAANAKARFRDVVNVYPSSPEAKLAKKKLS